MRITTSELGFKTGFVPALHCLYLSLDFIFRNVLSHSSFSHLYRHFYHTLYVLRNNSHLKKTLTEEQGIETYISWSEGKEDTTSI